VFNFLVLNFCDCLVGSLLPPEKEQEQEQEQEKEKEKSWLLHINQLAKEEFSIDKVGRDRVI